MGFIPENIPLTPMLQQYAEMKRNYPDAILLYRMGDFYELFFDDALTAAPILEVQLTSRDRSSANPIPMCGVPHHSVTPYLQKLLAKGHKVAICEQMEDPAQAKGIVKRDVIRVLTPALISDPALVPEETTNWLAALSSQKELALVDLLGGELLFGQVESEQQLLDLFYEYNPKELLVDDESSSLPWLKNALRAFPATLVTRRPNYFSKDSVGALKAYLKETQKLDSIPYLKAPAPLFSSRSMILDSTTIQSLEILKNFSGQENATLLHILDYTQTPMGRRTLKNWLIHPLGDVKLIRERQDVIEFFLRETVYAEDVKKLLAPIRDLERLTTKTALGLANPRDLVGIREILKQLGPLGERLSCGKAALLKKTAKEIDPLEGMLEKLESALEDEPPMAIREGEIFRETYNKEIKKLRELSRNGKGTIAALETREKERTGIPSLKLKYSKVFGYTIEITKSHLNKVPKDYIRKQTIANGERYITEELKNLEEKIQSADQKLRTLEEGLFLELRAEVGALANKLLNNARLIGRLDVLWSLSRAAKERGYHRPNFHDGWNLRIEEGRHPVVESLLDVGKFIPNDVEFDEDEARTWIITGPNMGGKSTIMRQVALICIMAQVGSFIPARGAELPILDSIFTRIGSSDDLARGRSTFMVEMTEVARILERASARSLILIDEIGRGTSTYDGLSLAWSLLEHIHDQIKAKTLFATHFHELTQLEKTSAGIRNANVLVERQQEDIVFLYRLAKGVCLQSYGVHVAKLAGLPSPVLQRAKAILGLLESHAQKASRTRSRALEDASNQLLIFEDLGSPETQTRLEPHQI